MGISCTTEFCNQVLAGTADLSKLPTTLQAIFHQPHQTHSVDINTVIDFEDFKDALHRWKESTSASPSGRHLSHYISLLKDIGDNTDDTADTILQLHHAMLQIAQHRYNPFARWKTETEVMLEKDKGDPKIDQLQIICLYEADYNISSR
jgi:hypothetical protein